MTQIIKNINFISFHNSFRVDIPCVSVVAEAIIPWHTPVLTFNEAIITGQMHKLALNEAFSLGQMPGLALNDAFSLGQMPGLTLNDAFSPGQMPALTLNKAFTPGQIGNVTFQNAGIAKTPGNKKLNHKQNPTSTVAYPVNAAPNQIESKLKPTINI